MSLLGLAKGFAILIAKLLACVLILVISTFWSTVVVLRILTSCFTKGFAATLSHVDRTKDQPPLHYKVWDEETRHSPGTSTRKWHHAYVTVPETRMRFHYVYSGKIPSHLAISDIDGETVTLAKEEDDDFACDPKLMLCIHGFPENWFSWRHVLRYFDNTHGNDEDYFVVAYDGRGYGDSDKPDGKMAYHLNTLVCDVKGIVRALGYETCICVAHDWGGVIAWTVTKIYPELFEKCIVLNCPHPTAGFWTALRNPKQLFLNSWYMMFYQMPILPEMCLAMGDYIFVNSALNGQRMGIKEKKNRLTEEEMKVFKYCLRYSLTGPINYYRAMLWPFCHPGPRLLYPRLHTGPNGQHTIPILLLWGDKDAAMIKQMAESSRSFINPSNGSKVVFVEGASHWLQQDQPEKVIKHVVKFLKE